jgi:hypothetical protein
VSLFAVPVIFSIFFRKSLFPSETVTVAVAPAS